MAKEKILVVDDEKRSTSWSALSDQRTVPSVLCLYRRRSAGSAEKRKPGSYHPGHHAAGHRRDRTFTGYPGAFQCTDHLSQLQDPGNR